MIRLIRLVSLALAALLLAASSGAVWAASTPSPDDVILRALREEMERSKDKLKLEGVPAPYYLEYRVTDLDEFEASAVFGTLRSQQRNRARILRATVRVGDYKQDSFFRTGEGGTDLVSLDDDIFAIRHRLWLATDRAYKLASEALSAKRAALKQLKVDDAVDDFAPAPAVQVTQPLARLAAVDFSPWLRLLEEATAKYRTDPQLEAWDASLRFTAENRYFLNSEGTVARTGQTRYVVYIGGSTQASDGMLLQRSRGEQVAEFQKLPSRDQFLNTADKLLGTLQQLREAPVVDEEYRGPVLFASDAAATVVSELVEPNVLGKKPALGENARTTGQWSSSYKSRVLPDFINVFDDPTISTISGQSLSGNYTIDDEGVRAQRVALVEKGQLVSYLVGRQPIRDVPASNGHGRASPTASASPYPGNLILQSSDPRPDAELKKKLMDICKQRDLPYCLYVATMGPRLVPRLLYRIWTKDGREELLRGAVFGDLDIRSLRNDLIAAGTALDVEDRSEPVAFSVASPALLFDELQVKRSEATKQKLPEYPAPAPSGGHE